MSFKSESSVTISEINSISGNSSLDNDKEIRRLQEKISRMESEKRNISLMPPAWMKIEVEDVEQCIDEFRVAFNQAKECIMEKRYEGEHMDNYIEKKRVTKATDAKTDIWMNSAKDLRRHLKEITTELNECCISDARLDSKYRHQFSLGGQKWKDVTLTNVALTDMPVLAPNYILPIIKPKTIRHCDMLVGTLKLLSQPNRRWQLPTEIQLKSSSTGSMPKNIAMDIKV